MTILRAVPAEAAELTRLAHAAKRHWGYPEAWISQWRDQLTITPASIASNEVWKAVAGGRIAGFAGWMSTGRRARLAHLWVLPEFMGQGVGRALFEIAASGSRASGWPVLEVVSDPHAEGFYRRMGARRVREDATEIDGTRRSLPVLELDLTRRGD